MGRRPDYNGGGSIENMKKGKHYDCRHRSEDGDCMNRASKWFGFMCRDVRGKCDDYFTFNDGTIAKNKKPQKPVSYITKKTNVVEKGDLVEFQSIKSNTTLKFVMSKNDRDISALVAITIGKTIGSIISYNGDKYKIVSIKCKTKLY